MIQVVFQWKKQKNGQGTEVLGRLYPTVAYKKNEIKPIVVGDNDPCVNGVLDFPFFFSGNKIHSVITNI